MELPSVSNINYDCDYVNWTSGTKRYASACGWAGSRDKPGSFYVDLYMAYTYADVIIGAAISFIYLQI